MRSLLADTGHGPPSEDGFTLIEVVLALTLLLIGVLGMFTAFTASQRLSLVSERHATMVHIGQKEIERLEGIPFSQVGITSSPVHSIDPANPDYYVVGGSPPTLQVNRSTGTAEPLIIDPAGGAITHTQPWSEGQLSGQIYDYVTWTQDTRCSPGCTGAQNYKRLTVAVSVGQGLHPTPVFVSSLLADPQAAPAGGVSNGSGGNPLVDPTTTCKDSSGATQPCMSPILSGNPNTWFLRDWPATSGGSPQPPSADHNTHPTVGAVNGLLCTTLTALASIAGNIAGCPVPDLMDPNQPSPTATTLYHYSKDLGTTGYPGGTVLQPVCATGLCSGSTGGGTGKTSDCSGGAFTSTLLNVQSHMWVSSPVTATTTLTGDGGVNLFTQTLGSTQGVVSFCIEIYDIPPSGSAGSLADILAWPPVDLGGAGYVAATDPATGGNWPTSPTQLSYIFNFRGSNGRVSIASGHRIGIRMWVKVNVNLPIDLIYDNPLYPTQVQLNSL